jgi:hypothetical protein
MFFRPLVNTLVVVGLGVALGLSTLQWLYDLSDSVAERLVATLARPEVLAPSMGVKRSGPAAAGPGGRTAGAYSGL